MMQNPKSYIRRFLPRNCLTEGLDRWYSEGGYLVFRKSSNGVWPHVLHVGHEGLQHYSPGAPLGSPVQALIGFDGVTWDRDLADAPPIPIKGILGGAFLLCGGVIVWVIGKALLNVESKILRIKDILNRGENG
jgi:hypothetical protein